MKHRHMLLTVLAALCLTGCSVQVISVPDSAVVPAAEQTTGVQTDSTTSVSVTVQTEIASETVLTNETTAVSMTSAVSETSKTTASSATTQTVPSTSASLTSASSAAKVTQTTKTTQTTASSSSAAGTSASSTSAAQQTEDTQWMLRLANKTHTVGDYVPPELTTLSNGTKVDSRMYPALQELYDAARAAGYKPFTREGYRTYAQQQDIMDTRIKKHLAEGYSQAGAKAQAEKYVAVPGTSEHQLGLAVDINSTDGNSWPLYGWLQKNAYKYGFILRYPLGAEKITGYSYEAWHYRYVGKEAAAEITKKGLTLEQYLAST